MTEEKALAVAPAPESDLETLRAAITTPGSPALTNSQLKLAIIYAQKVGADLFSRQIFPTVMEGRLTFIASIDFLRIVAERSGQYAGQAPPVYGEGPCDVQGCTAKGHPLWAEATIYRKGWEHPMTRRAYWHEYVPGGGRDFTWKKMPHVMLAKVAEAAALRAAFPNDMSGLYSGDEMEQAGDAPAQVTAGTSMPDIPPDAPLPELPFIGTVMAAPDGVRQVVRPDWCDWLTDKHVPKLELPIKVGGRAKHTAIFLGDVAYAVEAAGLVEGDRVAVDGIKHEYAWSDDPKKPKAKQIRKAEKLLVMRDNEWQAAGTPPEPTNVIEGEFVESEAIDSVVDAAGQPTETTVAMLQPELLEQARAVFDLPDDDVAPSVVGDGDPMKLPVWEAEAEEEQSWRGGLIQMEELVTSTGKEIYQLWVTNPEGDRRIEVVIPKSRGEAQVAVLGRGQLITVDGVGKAVGERNVVLASKVSPA